MKICRDWFTFTDKTPENDVVLCSSIRVARNLKEWKYFRRLLKEDAEKLALAQDAAMKKLPEFTFADLENFSFEEKQLMAEKNYIQPESITSPGKYIAFEKEKFPFVLFNEEDHIRIKCFSPGLDIFRAYNECNRVNERFKEVFDYQEHPKYGYLTSSLADTGTGLHVAVSFFLPGLTMDGRLDKFFVAAATAGLDIKGYVRGSEKIPRGDMYLIENRLAMGRSETEILMKINDIFVQIADIERESRNKILSENKFDIEDKVMRSYGILKFCKKLSVLEGIEMLSDIKLGIWAGLIDIPDAVVNRLFVCINKYHVAAEMEAAGQVVKYSDIDYMRADMVRDKLGLKGS